MVNLEQLEAELAALDAQRMKVACVLTASQALMLLTLLQAMEGRIENDVCRGFVGSVIAGLRVQFAKEYGMIHRVIEEGAVNGHGRSEFG
jgi:hypothetical protein